MNTLELDLSHATDQDVFLVVPVAAMFWGEPGSAFKPEEQKFLRGLAELGYWPVDFGEGNATHLSLWLKYDKDVRVAREACESFIKAGGNV